MVMGGETGMVGGVPSCSLSSGVFIVFPRRWGRQLWHGEPALMQEQFLHRPERLHLQQGMVNYGYTHRCPWGPDSIFHLYISYLCVIACVANYYLQPPVVVD